MRYLSVILIMIIIGLASCSGAGRPDYRSATYDRNFIYEEEILKYPNYSVYELIRAVRPRWVNKRGTKSMEEWANYPIVYVNGLREGSIEQLHFVSSQSVTEIQFLNAGDATIRYGVDHPSGAILVTIYY